MGSSVLLFQCTPGVAQRVLETEELGDLSQDALLTPPSSEEGLTMESEAERTEGSTGRAQGAKAAQEYRPDIFRSLGRKAEQVPPFLLIDEKGREFDSGRWVGKTSFVIVFFASWCRVCERKLPLLAEIIRQKDQIKVLAVAVDGPETWSHVPGFLREQRLDATPIIDAWSHPQFTEIYNPMSSIPLIAVVGPDGTLLDYQVGIEFDHEERLQAAFDKI
ncbi:MAG: TlpA family protein disulfide reductase [Polyangiaceae bacterium]|nr:TlpA family protein disulfide reductase [Polyangiaceae bacterium]